MVDQQAMTAAFHSGACPATGKGWGAFDAGLPVPSASPEPADSLLESHITRIVLCRFTGSSQTLSGHALVTDLGTINRLQNDLNDASADNSATCSDTDRVIVLAGNGSGEEGIDVSPASCPFLNNAVEAARYSGTSLPNDLYTLLEPHTTPFDRPLKNKLLKSHDNKVPDPG